MQEGLFEKLTGTYADGTPIRSVPLAARRIRSVVDHVQRLMETRKGSLIHLPDLGMPDIADLYRRLPGSTQEIQTELEGLLRKYEPRLDNIRVQFIEFVPAAARIRFRISGTLKGAGWLQLESSFFPTGRGEVRPSE